MKINDRVEIIGGNKMRSTVWSIGKTGIIKAIEMSTATPYVISVDGGGFGWYEESEIKPEES